MVCDSKIDVGCDMREIRKGRSGETAISHLNLRQAIGVCGKHVYMYVCHTVCVCVCVCMNVCVCVCICLCMYVLYVCDVCMYAMYAMYVYM